MYSFFHCKKFVDAEQWALIPKLMQDKTKTDATTKLKKKNKKQK